MPTPHFRKDIARLGDPDLGHIFTLADRYETSREATANRYIDFTPHRCAIIFSVGGRIRYPRICKGFPWLGVKTGESLPSASLSAQSAKTPERVLSEWTEIPGDVWLQTGRHGERLPIILEQTVPLSQGFRMTLLQIETIEEEEDDENDDLEESWTPRFRRR